MATKKKKPLGRPRLSAGERKRNNVTIRLRDELRARIAGSAEGNQRSLSEEIEQRIEQSYVERDSMRRMLPEMMALAYGRRLSPLLDFVAIMMMGAGHQAWRAQNGDTLEFPSDEPWLDDPSAYSAAVGVAALVFERLKPLGVAETSHLGLVKQYAEELVKKDSTFRSIEDLVRLEMRPDKTERK